MSDYEILYFKLLDTVESKMGDEGMSALMNWLLPSSANTLESLNFVENSTKLTITPPQLASFKNISLLKISQNRENMTVSSGAIFSNLGMTVYMSSSHVVTVEEGSFLGK